MGTFNYGSSDDIVTLGHYDGFDYFPSEEEIQEEMEEGDYSRDKAIEVLIENMSYQVQDDRDSIDSLIKCELSNLHFYTVQTVSGYYSGFIINIVQQYLCLDEYKDRVKIQKEITKIKAILIKCVQEYGMRVHYAGYCPGWEDTISDSIKTINKAIKEEREKVKKLPLFDPKDTLKHLKQ